VIETVVSIVPSSTGGGVASELLSMSYAEWLAWARQRGAMAFFRNLPQQTAAWVTRLRYLQSMGMNSYISEMAGSFVGRSVAFQSALGKIAAEEAFVAHSARIAAANAAATAAEGTLVAGAGTTAAAVILPVVALVAVGVALGAPYYQAREEAKKEGYASGFSKGFITGLLKWELRFTIDRFWDNAVAKNGFDEAIPGIRAGAHNRGLLKGRMAGLAKGDDEKKRYLKGLRMLTKTSTAGWTSRSDDWMEQMRARQVQISFVIDLAAAASKHKVLSEAG
jgi:hypothetical protein